AMRNAVEHNARDPFRQEVWDELAGGMRYFMLESGEEMAAAARLGSLLTEIDEERETHGNRLYYFAVPPRALGWRVRVGAAGPPAEGWKGLIIEKPFGRALATARQLNALVQEHFTESEIFRIDHSLGKETVQNIMALRFANGIFEPIWNRQFIDHVQISVAETVGVEHRGKFYEKTGALRDMVPNHVFQLLAMTAMEPPISFDADPRKLKSFRPSSHSIGPRCSRMSCAASMTPAGCWANRFARIARNPMWRRIRRPRHILRAS